MDVTLSFFSNYERARCRQDLARILWHLPYEKLLEFGISSYRDITQLDVIGIPVWVSYRPPSTSVSVSCGKSLDPLMAFAGCITEGIENWAAENPTGQNYLMSWTQLNEKDPVAGAALLPLGEYPLARDNVLDEHTPISWEIVQEIGQGPGQTTTWMPSNMIWLTDRVSAQFLDVQQSSNGLAAGTDTKDAVLSGIYELVERDGWTVTEYVREQTGKTPLKIPLWTLPRELKLVVEMMFKAKLFPFLYDCTTDLGIPVIGCALLGTDGVGAFGGYGSSLNPRVAAMRALTEAAQSRLCWIGGARDDLYRRDFLLIKRASSKWLIEQLEQITSPWKDWSEYCNARIPDHSYQSTGEELSAVIKWLNGRGIHLYFKHLRRSVELDGPSLEVVKVISPQLEGVYFDSWKTNGRALAALKKEMHEQA